MRRLVLFLAVAFWAAADASSAFALTSSRPVKEMLKDCALAYSKRKYAEAFLADCPIDYMVEEITTRLRKRRYVEYIVSAAIGSFASLLVIFGTVLLD